MANVFYSFGKKNVFIINDHSQTAGSAEGGVYAGGKATYNNYNVGTTLPVVFPPNNIPHSFSLFVLGEMNITGGTNTQNAALPLSGILTNYTMVSVGGLLGQPLRETEWIYPTLNLSNWLECSSYGWAMLPTNATSAISGTTLTLTGSDPTLNTFYINGSNILGSGTALGSITNLNINVPASSTVLFNIDGTTLALNNVITQFNGITPPLADSQKILYNFPTSTSIAINSPIFGSILAPFASVSTTSSTVQIGTMFAKNLSGGLISRLAEFIGDLPQLYNPSSTSSCSYSTTTTTTSSTTTTTSSSTTTTTTTTSSTTTPVPPPWAQAISDLYVSVALEQTALSHILNAEGEKIQKILALNSSADMLIKINKSVESMVNAISALELGLISKIETANKI